jgi:hypothetical protein
LEVYWEAAKALSSAALSVAVADTCTNGQDATMSTTIATIKLIGRFGFERG